jgi:ribosomal protein L25 (general stress protein Ctc)
MKIGKKYNRPKLMDSNVRKVRNAVRVIEMYGLAGKSRVRITVYRRFYMMAKLRQIGCTFEMIGELFNKDHSAVVYAVKNHDYFVKINDLQYKLAVEPVKTTFKVMNQEVQLNIYSDVLSCLDFNDLLLIKEKIHNGMYN